MDELEADQEAQEETAEHGQEKREDTEGQKEAVISVFMEKGLGYDCTC